MAMSVRPVAFVVLLWGCRAGAGPCRGHVPAGVMQAGRRTPQAAARPAPLKGEPLTGGRV